MAQHSRRSSYESHKTPTITEKKGRKIRGIKKDQLYNFKDGFSWDKYLQQCGLSAAPNECFKQSRSNISLVNKFDLDDKLEAQDPRNPSSICLATVVSIQGPRILLRLDGSDACNDFWRLVDSGDIYPLGTHEATEGLLQPPLGFTRNMSTWASFLERNRKKSKSAEEDCFVKEPPTLDKNLFEIGMKLEAVDKKNPHLICPATIGDINEEQVFISFDGWRGAMDYWCDYSSRDLFPIHWCSENDHPLQEPGSKGDNPHVMPNLKLLVEESKRQTRSTHAANESTTEHKERSTRLVEPRPLTPKPRGRQHKMKNSLSANQQSPTSGSVKRVQKTKKTSQPDESANGGDVDNDNINTMVNEESDSESCDSSASSSGGDSSSEDVKNDSHIRNRSLQELESMPASDTKVENRRGRKRKRRAKNLKSKTAEDGVKKQKEEPSEENIENKLTKTFSNESKKGEFPSPESPFCQKTSPSSFFGSNREEIVRKASVGWPSRSQYMLGLSGSAKVVTSDNKLGRFGEDVQTNNEDEEVETKNEEDKKMEEVYETGENKSEVEIKHKTSRKKSIETSDAASHATDAFSELKPSNKLRTSMLMKKGIKLPLPRKRSRNPRNWSVYDVMYFIQEQDSVLASYACLFPLHEIDGEALLLLTSVMAVKFMGLKLGPALKLANILENLKRLASL